MSEAHPTREDAAAALAEVELRSAQIRRADSQLRWMLLVLLAADLGVAALFSVSPHRASAAWAIVGLVVTAIALVVIAGLRIRAYSRSGILLYFGTIVAFNLWNALVTAVSIGTRFWAMGQPAYHFGISEILGAMPIAIGIWALSRRR